MRDQEIRLILPKSARKQMTPAPKPAAKDTTQATSQAAQAPATSAVATKPTASAVHNFALAQGGSSEMARLAAAAKDLQISVSLDALVLRASSKPSPPPSHAAAPHTSQEKGTTRAPRPPSPSTAGSHLAIDGYDPLHEDGAHDVDALLAPDELPQGTASAQPTAASQSEQEMWALYEAAKREMLGEDAKGIMTKPKPRLVGTTVNERVPPAHVAVAVNDPASTGSETVVTREQQPRNGSQARGGKSST